LRSRVLHILAVAAVSGGVFLLGTGIKYIWSYLSEPGNAYRHEYLQGMAIAVIMSVPFWLVASGIMHMTRQRWPRVLLFATHTITALVCGSVFFGNVYTLVCALING